jgi:hypothetical protein
LLAAEHHGQVAGAHGVAATRRLGRRSGRHRLSPVPVRPNCPGLGNRSVTGSGIGWKSPGAGKLHPAAPAEGVCGTGARTKEPEAPVWARPRRRPRLAERRKRRLPIGLRAGIALLCPLWLTPRGTGTVRPGAGREARGWNRPRTASPCG